MEVQEIGFFRELPHGNPQGPSLRESIGKGDASNREKIAEYLAGGSILATTGERVPDVLKGDAVDAGPLAIQTDGRWAWSADLAYYVSEYNVQLPEEFISLARAADWSPPALSREEMNQVERAMFPEAYA